MNLKDALDMFGADDKTSVDAIRTRYRVLAKEYHPDAIRYEKMPAAERTRRTKYWTELTEALDVIKRHSSDGKSLAVDWKSQDYYERFNNIVSSMLDFKFAVGNPEEAARQAQELEEINRVFENMFENLGDAKKKLGSIFFSGVTELSDERVKIVKDYTVEVGNWTYVQKKPIIILEESYSGFQRPFTELGSDPIQFRIIEPLRAIDRLRGRQFMPLYLTWFLQRFGLDSKVGSKEIDEICREIDEFEKQSVSEDSFRAGNHHIDLDALGAATDIVEKHNLKNLGRKNVNSSEEHDTENDVSFALREEMGYKSRAKKSDGGYEIKALTWTDFPEDVAMVDYNLSNDDVKILELLSFGSMIFNEKFRQQLSLLRPELVAGKPPTPKRF